MLRCAVFAFPYHAPDFESVGEYRVNVGLVDSGRFCWYGNGVSVAPGQRQRLIIDGAIRIYMRHQILTLGLTFRCEK